MDRTIANYVSFLSQGMSTESRMDRYNFMVGMLGFVYAYSNMSHGKCEKMRSRSVNFFHF